MQLDVADSFEKRIKSRFSHRQVLLYSLDTKIFYKVINKVFTSHANQACQAGNSELEKAFTDLRGLAESQAVHELLEFYQEAGK